MRWGDRLAANDFPHVEARIDWVEAHAREEHAAMEGRIGEWFDRMEARLLEAIRGGSEPDPDRATTQQES